MYKINPVSDQVKHTAAHILAAAVTRIYPEAKIGIGPVTKEGFFYDFDLNTELTDDDIPRIESEINQIIQENLPMQQIILDREEAINMLLQRGQIYKAEIARAVPDSEISFYKTGDGFIDLCRGPHVYSTSEIGPVKIQKIEEAYWNEDSTRPKLQRVYGIVFNNIDDLNSYYKLKQEEKERNFLTLIKTANLGFSVNQHVQLNERGTMSLNRIEKYFHTNILDGPFEEIYLTNNQDLDDVSAKMTSILLYKNRSPREFPKTLKTEVEVDDRMMNDNRASQKVLVVKKFFFDAEGLINITQIESFIEIFKDMEIELSADLFSLDLENTFVSTLSNLLQRKGISHNKIAKSLGEQVKISLKGVDLFKREWKLADVIFERNITTSNISAGKNKLFTIEFRVSPLAIFAHVLENTKADLPKSLSPFEIVVIPINKNFVQYASDINILLNEQGYFSRVDLRSKSLKRKIFLAGKDKSEVQIIVGNKELETQSASVRHKDSDVGLIRLEDLKQFLRDMLRTS